MKKLKKLMALMLAAMMIFAPAAESFAGKGFCESGRFSRRNLFKNLRTKERDSAA